MKIKDLKARLDTWPDDAEVKVKMIVKGREGSIKLFEIASFGGYTSDWVPANSWLEIIIREK